MATSSIAILVAFENRILSGLATGLLLLGLSASAFAFGTDKFKEEVAKEQEAVKLVREVQQGGYSIMTTEELKAKIDASSSSTDPASLALSAPVDTVSTWGDVDMALWFEVAAHQQLFSAGCTGNEARRAVAAPGGLGFRFHPVQGVAGAEGIEPPTFGFGDRRSAN